MECENNYYIESALGILLIVSELLAKSGCKYNSISEFIHSFTVKKDIDINIET